MMEPAVLCLLLLSAACSAEVLFQNERLTVSTDSGGRLSFDYTNTDGSVALHSWTDAALGSEVELCDAQDSALCLQWGQEQKLTLLFTDDTCDHYTWPPYSTTGRWETCFDQGDLHWYGGPEQKVQHWPFEKLNFTEYSYVTKEKDSMAVVESYWLLSNGMYIYVDINVPLFLNQGNGSFCLVAENADPYPPTRQTLHLGYYVCRGEDAKQAHLQAVQKFLWKPSAVPDERMVRHPIWSTWARYKRDIDENIVSTFAEEILRNGFNNSQLEIDDFWETCYGSLSINTTKFPDMKNLTDSLKQKGFRVTMWVHPFVNFDCEPYFSEALAAGHLVLNTDGDPSTHWWNGDGGHVDFTKSEAFRAWFDRLHALQAAAGIDSFKFDAGETSWLPQLPVLSVKEDVNPNQFTSMYAEWAYEEFRDMVEVRVGYRTQHVPVFVRMLDKDSKWSFQNGLPTLVTTLLQMNMVGYPFVLPDMVGGNGYNDDVLTKELFIRWLQANVFMPAIQFSFVPWDFDNETVEISRRYTALHAQYADAILAAMRRAVSEGAPVNPPIWWVDPADTVAQTIDSEYLLGEDTLVAPVLREGAVNRDIYLPRGSWRDEANPDHPVIQGPTWLYSYPAPLDTLPYFTRGPGLSTWCEDALTHLASES
ncbi:myogenesis-regulating glycosidase-like [Schistocerca serialis cubense]|uniref:myogenesis-regulating glycosidase-like n=1 Tax=Schistocerca serialis cubense TaxID=2023355 RepID=UPI00214DF7F0|nr:myogenesis-regulating glycosidase-like [Schistocerca serialis cubense]XP_049938005.1 myogenesis-regulating glycosidase-like [Schistocerca serialis cubense]